MADALSPTRFDGRALDRAMLAVFAACVLEGGGGPVLDLGCGPADPQMA